MSSVAHHFVRRAVDAAQYAHSAATSANTSDGEKIKELAPWGILLLAATGIMYLVVVASVCALTSDRQERTNGASRSTTPMAMLWLP